eukprot:1151768-Pelagomonas_calceolata.AAC.6
MVPCAHGEALNAGCWCRKRSDSLAPQMCRTRRALDCRMLREHMWSMCKEINRSNSSVSGPGALL